MLLDRPEMQHGTSGQNSDRPGSGRVDRQTFQVPRIGYNQVPTDHIGMRFSMRCKRTSISAGTEKRRLHAMEQSPSGRFHIDDGQEATVEENEVPHISLQDRSAFRHPGYRAAREEPNVAQKSEASLG